MNNLDFAFQVMVVGFLVVMFILFLLFAILVVFNRIFYRDEAEPSTNKKFLTDKAELIAPVMKPQMVAAISAAVYQYMLEEKPHLKLESLNISIEGSAKSYHAWKINGRKALLEKSAELANIRRQKHRENF